MSGRFRLPVLWVSLSLLLLSGCQIWNNKWIRVRRGPNPEATRIQLGMPVLMGPKEQVERFFHAYARKDWKGMATVLDEFSDLHYIQDKVQKDFDRYVEIIVEVKVKRPVFNDARDKAQVDVKFEIEKIDQTSGALHQAKGSGSFVVASKGGWEILGYIGDPFWGTGEAEAQ